MRKRKETKDEVVVIGVSFNENLDKLIRYPEIKNESNS